MNRFVAGILIVVGGLAALSCGGGSSPSGGYNSPTAPSGGTTAGASGVVTIVGNNGAMSFSPDPVTVRVGQALSWKNADGIAHQIVQDSTDPASNGGGYYGGGDSVGTGFNMGQVAPGSTSRTVSFTTNGTVTYHCSIHPGMTGTILVGN